jgi:hypothetical protein
MTPLEKRKLLVKLVELMLYTGYDISDLMGRPLSYFDFEKIKVAIKKYQKEYDSQ